MLYRENLPRIQCYNPEKKREKKRLFAASTRIDTKPIKESFCHNLNHSITKLKAAVGL